MAVDGNRLANDIVAKIDRELGSKHPDRERIWKLVGAAVATEAGLSLADRLHAATHASAGSDPVALALSQVTGLVTSLDGKEPISTYSAVTGSGALAAGDGDLVAVVTSLSSDVTLTLPDPSPAGRRIHIVDGVGLAGTSKLLRVDADSGDTIAVPGEPSRTSLLACRSNASLTLVAGGGTVWYLLAQEGWAQNPSSIANMKQWLDARRGVTLNGSTVSGWADQSGNGLDVSQPTGAQQPVFVSSDTAINGHPALEFDGARQFNSVTWATDGAAITVFIVLQPNNIGAYHNVFERNGNVPPQFWIQTSGKLELNGATGGVPFSANSTWQIASTVSRASGNAKSQLHVDGLLASQSTVGPTAVPASDTYTLFNRASGSRFNGRVAEMLVYGRALTETEIRLVEKYLRATYSKP